MFIAGLIFHSCISFRQFMPGQWKCLTKWNNWTTTQKTSTCTELRYSCFDKDLEIRSHFTTHVQSVRFQDIIVVTSTCILLDAAPKHTNLQFQRKRTHVYKRNVPSGMLIDYKQGIDKQGKRLSLFYSVTAWVQPFLYFRTLCVLLHSRITSHI